MNQNSIRILADIYRNNGEHKMYLLSLIYLETLQNFSGANIVAITEIVKKIVEIGDNNGGFEGEINAIISDKVLTKSEDLVEEVRSKIISEGSEVSRKIKEKLDSKIPNKK